MEESSGLGSRWSHIRGEPIPCLSQFLWLQASFGLWLHHYNLCLPGHIASSSSVSVKSPSASLTPVMPFRAHLDNPREALHLKILDNIYQDPFSLDGDIYWFQGLGPDIFGGHFSAY